jgi:predicted phage-related endonuclease
MKRTVLSLQQGSQQWLDARMRSDGTASEAPAMFGKSKYQTRTELLNQRKTGIAKEVNASTQALFDKGHKSEAAARINAEEIIGDELSPTTYMIEIEGLKLMASLDGITFNNGVIFEHKLWNESLAEQVRCGKLDEHYTIQMDQELMASGAIKCLFMVSDGTKDKCESMWYESSQEKFNAIITGWKQFHRDLEMYVPPVRIEKVEAEEVKALPVPSVVVRGEVTVSNLNEITPKFDAYLSNIKTELKSDQDFADAEANAKNCRETAKRIEALQENIIGQMVSVNEVNSVLENYKTAFNKIGLQLEKAVKEQKESLKTTAIMKAKVAYADFVTELNKDIPVMLSQQLVCPDFATAIKGVKTIETMQSRINDALANGKAEATTLSNDVKAKLAYITEATKGYEHLINVHQLAFTDLDYIKLHIQSVKDAEDKRKAEHETAIKEKAEAEARAKLEAEAKAKAEDKTLTAVQQADHERQLAQSNELVSPFNQNDFNNVFSVGIAPDAQPETESTGTAWVKPSRKDLIACVANRYAVTHEVAQNWLIEAFEEQAKAA